MMRLLVVFVAIVVLLPVAASSQAGYIGLFSDYPYYVDCDYVDAGPALVPVYVVHKLTPGATASQFMVRTGGGFNCTYTGEIVHMPVSIGSTYYGISIGYGGCRASDILLVTINYFCMGISPPCAYLEVVPDPTSATGKIEVFDCAYVRLIGNGSTFYMNPDGSCDCGQVVPVEETTWGQIKAQYQ